MTPPLPHRPTPTAPGPPPRGRLRLRPIRLQASRRLDTATTPYVKSSGRGGDPLPPYVDWADFYPRFADRFEPGDHVTAVGATRSGKTTLLRQVAYLRRYVAVAATKVRDPSLYRPLENQGFELVEDFDPDVWERPRQIVRPVLADPSAASKADQRAAFEAMIGEIWNMGRVAIFADEVRYLTDTLKLATEMEVMWLQGGSLEASVISSTQRPVGIPLEAFSSAKHLFLFRTTDKRDVIRCAEFVAGDQELVRHTITQLPKWEVLYVERETGRMTRTKVVVPAGY